MRNFLRLEVNPNRVYGLDILRALAILFVLIGHSRYFFRPIISEKYLSLVVFDGVSIFFVLSGFLIGKILITTLMKNDGLNFSLIQFWINRWTRTIPTYFLILTLLIIVSYFEGNINWDSAKFFFVFLQNFNTPHPDSFFPEAWSLAVEEWFYIITPITMFILKRVFSLSIKKSVLIPAILIILISTFIRYQRYCNDETINEYLVDVVIKKQVITRLDSLMFGIIGSYIFIFHKTNWDNNKTYLFVIGLLLLLTHKTLYYFHFESFAPYYTIFSFTLFSIGTLLILPFLENIKKGNGLLYKTLTYTSLVSYSMYLLNLSIIQLRIIPSIIQSFGIQNLNYKIAIEFFLFWILTVILSLLLFKHFELPTMRLRKWIYS